jgi:hypothetical protein
MMIRARVSFPVFVPLLLLAGCGSSSSGPSGNIVLADTNNYTTTASLNVPVVETTPATDLDICWSAVTDDLQCHALSAVTDLDNVGLLRISHLSQDQVQTRVAAGTLSMSDVAGYLDHHTDHATTCTKLSQFSFFGTAIDVPSEYIESADYTYLLLFSKGTTPGIGARTMMFLKPTSTSTNTRVDAPSGCGMLMFSADLSLLTKVKVPAAGPWVIDWHGVTRDGPGNAFPSTRIDGVSIGFYEGMTVADLQARIFDIEMIATQLWDIKLMGGKTADLAEAKDRATGAAFTGFDRAAAGTWMLALTCSGCQSPAPPLLTILDTGAGGS